MASRPALVAHADWSTSPAKRWMAVARLSRGIYELTEPEPVGETADLLARLQRRAGGMPFVVGFDFPIGVPMAYAERAGITSFVAALPQFGHGRWSQFYDLAETRPEISLERPFYPRRAGGTSQRDLVQGLGVTSMDALYRRCEISEKRPRACSLFWTLGANQVGRAAISGWREVLTPALAHSAMSVAVWPFHGELPTLLAAHECVLVETYPAEACLHVGVPLGGWSKRRRADRQVQGRRLLDRAAERPEVRISPSLDEAIRDGFSDRGDGEDRFDAVIGLVSMLEVIGGRRRDGAPQPSAALTVEGWIFGQRADAAALSPVTEGDRDLDVGAQTLPGNGEDTGGKSANHMNRVRLLASAGDAAPLIAALLSLEGEGGILLLPRERCLSMRVNVGGDQVPMLNIFERGVHFSPHCPCLYIDGNVLRDRRGQDVLDVVHARLATDALWCLHKVDLQCPLDRAFSQDEISTVVGFVRRLRGLISKPVGAA